MEILNNIWHMLTTENELFMNIILFIAGFIENYIALNLFSLLLNIKPENKIKIIYILSCGLCGFITNTYIPSPFSIFINYVFVFLLLHYLFKLNILNSFVAIIIPQLLFALNGTLIINPLCNLLNTDLDLLYVIPIYRITYLLISYIIMFLLVYILKIKSININLLEELDKKSRKIIYINLTLGFFTICLQVLLIYYYVNSLPIIVTFLSSLSLIAYFGISFYSLTRVIKLQTTTRDLEKAESYNETLQTLYDNVKSFKHDFDNMIHMLDGYLKNDDMNGLKEYYYDLTKDYDRVNAISVLNPNVINNPGIYNMLVSKYKRASDCGVKLHIEFFMDFNSLHMPIYEFSRVLGILLDNAIEAASECDNKIVNIMFRTSSRDNVELVKIENTFKNKDIDLKEIFKKDISTKEKHMGMGLWEVNQIVNRFNNIKLVPSKEDEYFCQQLEIYY